MFPEDESGLQPSGVDLALTVDRSVAAARLPDHMIPRRFVHVDAVPLTLNEKVDWRALPPPPVDRPALDAPYVAPRGALEALAADIWQQVLRGEPVGVHDDFLELGGARCRPRSS